MGIAAAGGPGALARAADNETPDRPNIVFILIDDLGWRDLSCYGSGYYRTPNIDRLADQGVKFTDAYAACPVCSPTRASIMTGKYPATLNLTDFIPGHDYAWAKLTVPKFNQHLPPGQVTLAEALKAAGYVTGGWGKWHLGAGQAHGPTKHGFHVFETPPNRLDKRVAGLTDKALAFIKASKDRPFFAFLSHFTVHIPLEASKERIERWAARLKPGQANPTYAAMIEAMDDSVGRIMAGLDDLKLADNTVVIFFSDNGGLIKTHTGRGPTVTSNLPLRSEKGSLYEGGIRVPLIVRWPGKAKPGSVCRVPVTSTDFHPTLLAAAGVKGEVIGETDGCDLGPLLTRTGSIERQAIFWHYPHYHHTAPCGAVRAGKWKLIEYFEDGRGELYDLAEDIGEAKDLAKTNPAKAAELRALLKAWRKRVGAKMPTPNPDYDPARAREVRRRPKR